MELRRLAYVLMACATPLHVAWAQNALRTDRNEPSELPESALIAPELYKHTISPGCTYFARDQRLWVEWTGKCMDGNLHGQGILRSEPYGRAGTRRVATGVFNEGYMSGPWLFATENAPKDSPPANAWIGVFYGAQGRAGFPVTLNAEGEPYSGAARDDEALKAFELPSPDRNRKVPKIVFPQKLQATQNYVSGLRQAKVQSRPETKPEPSRAPTAPTRAEPATSVDEEEETPPSKSARNSRSSRSSGSGEGGCSEKIYRYCDLQGGGASVCSSVTVLTWGRMSTTEFDRAIRDRTRSAFGELGRAELDAMRCVQKMKEEASPRQSEGAVGGGSCDRPGASNIPANKAWCQCMGGSFTTSNNNYWSCRKSGVVLSACNALSGSWSCQSQ